MAKAGNVVHELMFPVDENARQNIGEVKTHLQYVEIAAANNDFRLIDWLAIVDLLLHGSLLSRDCFCC